MDASRPSVRGARQPGSREAAVVDGGWGLGTGGAERQFTTDVTRFEGG